MFPFSLPLLPFESPGSTKVTETLRLLSLWLIALKIIFNSLTNDWGSFCSPSNRVIYEPIVHLVAEVKIIQAMQILSREQMFSLLIKINEFYPGASEGSCGKGDPNTNNFLLLRITCVSFLGIERQASPYISTFPRKINLTMKSHYPISQLISKAFEFI